jgi:hypothetical protein
VGGTHLTSILHPSHETPSHNGSLLLYRSISTTHIFRLSSLSNFIENFRKPEHLHRPFSLEPLWALRSGMSIQEGSIMLKLLLASGASLLTTPSSKGPSSKHTGLKKVSNPSFNVESPRFVELYHSTPAVPLLPVGISRILLSLLHSLYECTFMSVFISRHCFIACCRVHGSDPKPVQMILSRADTPFLSDVNLDIRTFGQKLWRKDYNVLVLNRYSGVLVLFSSQSQKYPESSVRVSLNTAVKDSEVRFHSPWGHK